MNFYGLWIHILEQNMIFKKVPWGQRWNMLGERKREKNRRGMKTGRKRMEQLRSLLKTLSSFLSLPFYLSILSLSKKHKKKPISIKPQVLRVCSCNLCHDLFAWETKLVKTEFFRKKLEWSLFSIHEFRFGLKPFEEETGRKIMPREREKERERLQLSNYLNKDELMSSLSLLLHVFFLSVSWMRMKLISFVRWSVITKFFPTENVQNLKLYDQLFFCSSFTTCFCYLYSIMFEPRNVDPIHFQHLTNLFSRNFPSLFEQGKNR